MSHREPERNYHTPSTSEQKQVSYHQLTETRLRRIRNTNIFETAFKPRKVFEHINYDLAIDQMRAYLSGLRSFINSEEYRELSQGRRAEIRSQLAECITWLKIKDVA